MFGPEQIISCLKSTCAQGIETDFSNFLASSGVKKWLIATDFCIGDTTRFNDTFVYTIFPYDAFFDEIQDEIHSISPKDIKGIKRVNDRMLEYLKSSRRFTFCFIPNRDRQWVPDLSMAQKSVEASINMMRSWHDADKQAALIKVMEGLRQEMQAKSFNISLLGDIVFTAIFAGFVAFLVAKHNTPEIIGWFPDRDKITEAYQKIAYSLLSINFSAFCQQQNVRHDAVKLAFGIPNTSGKIEQGVWYDPLIRVPDYIAGAIAAWDFEKNLILGDVPKFLQIAEEVIADSTNIKLIRVVYGETKLYASQIKVGKKPEVSSS